jgi:hypothetical protein
LTSQSRSLDGCELPYKDRVKATGVKMEVAMNEAGDEVIRLQVLPGDDDPEQLDELTSLLRDELLDLDVAAVEPLTQESAPNDAKGALAALGGWLAVHFGAAGLKAGLRAVVNVVASWAGRTGKTVELSIGGDTLKLTGASAEMQSRIVDEFFARQSGTD